ncbi:plasmid mobilization protein [Pseudomonas frederiksbergensis]|uniref:plasmid mobilization protein n=1 Tax=Pseudomonas frederiksbergensis TaxID=104087 RepID=UPI003D263073
MDNTKAPRSVQINGIVTLKQREKFNKQARAAGMTNSQFLVALLDKKPVVTAKESLRDEVKELISWFGRINSNLNMLSKHANTFRDNANTAVMLHELNDIRRDVYHVTQASEKLHKRRGRPSND